MSETKQEPCECRVRKALDSITRIPVMPFPDPGAHSWRAFAEAVHTAYQRIQQQAHAALSDPCSCEQLREELTELKAQEALAWKEANGLDDKLSLLHDQLVQSQAEVLNGKELLAGKVLTIQQLRERAAELEMARDVAQDSAALWTKNAFTAVGELHAARSLLEEAREALNATLRLTSAMETCHICEGSICIDDGPTFCESCSSDCEYHQEPNCAPLGSLHGDAKREAARTPEVKR